MSEHATNPGSTSAEQLGAQGADIDPFHDADPPITMQKALMELPMANVNRVDVGGSSLQQAVGESARRCSGVNDASIAYRRQLRILIQSSFELEATSTHEPRRGAQHDNCFVSRYQAGWFVRWRSSDNDEPSVNGCLGFLSIGDQGVAVRARYRVVGEPRFSAAAGFFLAVFLAAVAFLAGTFLLQPSWLEPSSLLPSWPEPSWLELSSPEPSWPTSSPSPCGRPNLPSWLRPEPPWPSCSPSWWLATWLHVRGRSSCLSRSLQHTSATWAAMASRDGASILLSCDDTS